MRLQNKVAVVTGAGSGMGKAIAVLYAQEGAKVVVSDINEGTAQETVNEIKAQGGEAIAVVANVAKEEDIQNLIDTAVSTYDTVDILVNNAGIMDGMQPAGEIEDELWERVFAVNTTSVMRATRKVLPIFLEKQQGVIINIASIGGLWDARRCCLHRVQACSDRLHQKYRLHVCPTRNSLQRDRTRRRRNEYRIVDDQHQPIWRWSPTARLGVKSTDGKVKKSPRSHYFLARMNPAS